MKPRAEPGCFRRREVAEIARQKIHNLISVKGESLGDQCDRVSGFDHPPVEEHADRVGRDHPLTRQSGACIGAEPVDQVGLSASETHVSDALSSIRSVVR